MINNREELMSELASAVEEFVAIIKSVPLTPKELWKFLGPMFEALIEIYIELLKEELEERNKK